MKKTLFSVGTLIVGIVLFIFAIKFIGWQTIVDQFKTIQPIHIMIYLAVSMTLATVLIIKWKLVLKVMGYKVPFHNLFMYRQMGYSIGYVVPSFYIGGETIKALFLKKHKIPTSDAVASVLIDRSLEIPLNFLLACVMFFLVIHTLDLPLSMLIGLAVILLVLVLLGVLFFYKIIKKEYMFSRLFIFLRLNKIKKLSKIQIKIKEVETHLIRFFHNRKSFFPVALFFSIILWVLMILEFKTALLIVGYNATLAQIYLVVTMTGFAMMFPVPASIGIMELSQIAIAILVGIPAPVAVALSFLVRTRDLMWIIMGIGSYFYTGTSYIKALIGDLKNNKK